jgi:hypothetical protein
LSCNSNGNGRTDIDVNRYPIHELGRAGLQIAHVEELTVAENRATAIGAFGTTALDRVRLTALKRVRLAIDLARRIGR